MNKSESAQCTYSLDIIYLTFLYFAQKENKKINRRRDVCTVGAAGSMRANNGLKAFFLPFLSRLSLSLADVIVTGRLVSGALRSK